MGSFHALVFFLALLLSCYSSASAEWKNADPNYRLSLPADHAAHPDTAIEWWYYTGNLETSEGREFGYQVTFFRIGVDSSPDSKSRWALDHIYMAHVAVSDIQAGLFSHQRRLGRGALGRSGAEKNSYHVWVDSWSVQLAGPHHLIQVDGDAFALNLALGEGPLMLQGENGYSEKSSTPGNASHYYSLPRMPTTGRLEIRGEVFNLSGLSWMDHEYGSSFLDKGQLGWDWFSLQLDNKTSIMLFRIRSASGQAFYRGTVLKDDGSLRELSSDDFVLTELDYWQSATSGAKYPISWLVKLKQEKLDLTVTAAMKNQELTGDGVNYWEGAMRVSGSARGRNVTGKGYLEMTGYSGRSMAAILSENLN